MDRIFIKTIEEWRGMGEFFTGPDAVHICRAPGRLDLMGGNDDYTGGLVFESTIRECTYAAAQCNGSGKVLVRNRSASEKGWAGELHVALDLLSDEHALRDWVNSDPDRRWCAYVLGVLHYLCLKHKDKMRVGLSVYLDSKVPLNRGVSSSAAVEVSVMKAAAAAIGVEMKGMELAQACQWVENTIAGAACGIMDQAAVVTGRAGHVMPMICQPCEVEELIKLPEALRVWGVDSGVSHQVTGIEYEAARAAAFMGYKIICDHEGVEVVAEKGVEIPRYTDAVWNGYLANLSVSEFRWYFQSLLPEVMSMTDFLEGHQFHPDPFTPLKPGVTYRVLANTKYAVEENQRVMAFSELSRGAALTGSKRAYQLMGEVMYRSHVAYSECGLGSAATDHLVTLCRNKGMANGIYGAKITGGGAGGTVAILADKDAGETIHRIVREYAASGHGDPYLFEGSSDGADAFGVVVIA